MPGEKRSYDDFDFDGPSGSLEQDVDAFDGNVDMNALGQAIDTSWGRSSTPKTTQYSVKFQIGPNDTLVANFCCIVNFASEKEKFEQKRRYSEESTRVIDAHLKNVKQRYKDLCGSTLKVSEIATDESVEVINMSFHSPKRTAYLRRKTVFQVT